MATDYAHISRFGDAMQRAVQNARGFNAESLATARDQLAIATDELNAMDWADAEGFARELRDGEYALGLLQYALDNGRPSHDAYIIARAYWAAL